MRRQLALGAAAVTITVVFAFLVPLAAAVRVLAAERATDAAQLESQSLAAVLATVTDADTLTKIVAEQNARSGDTATVFLPTGEVVGDPAPGGASLDLARRGRAFTASVNGGRAVFVPIRGQNGAITVVRVSVPNSELTRGVSRVWLLLACLGAALVLVAVVLADRMALSVVGPMGRLARIASDLEQGRLESRVEPAGPPEVATVGHALNQLADRIDDLLASEREAVADISHGLRTPLTVLRLDADALRDADERARLAADADELEAAVTQMISEARRPSERRPAACDLTDTVASLAAFWEALARSQDRPFDVILPDERLAVALSRNQLAAVVEALLGNVFAHTPDGTAFRLLVQRTGPATAELVVEDAGPGFPPGLTPARGSSQAGSTGLGLDIARRAAERAGGAFNTGASALGGARVVLSLPLVGPSPPADEGDHRSLPDDSDT